MPNLTLADYVRRELLAGKKLTKFEIQDGYKSETGQWVDSSSVGSRIRDVRREGYRVEIEKVEGHRGVFKYYIQPKETLFQVSL